MANGVRGQEVTRASGIARGLGLSPNLTRLIQQQNIDEFRDLQSALATSRATLEEERQRQRERAVQTAISEQGPRGGINVRRTSSVDTPTAVVIATSQPLGGDLFGITLRKEGQQLPQTERFNSEQEFRQRLEELQTQGVRLLAPGVQESLPQTLVDRFRIERTSVPVATRIFQPARGFPGAARGRTIATGPKPQLSPEQKAIQAATGGTDTRGKFRIGDLSVNTRASLIADTLAFARQADPLMAIKLQGALSLGRAGELIEEKIRKGEINARFRQ